jgi:DNA-binding NtrC family response regulator
MQDACAFYGMVGRSPAMLETFEKISKVAAGDTNVCIYGERGTGKELIARAIHYCSLRAHRPRITVDCTTIPDPLIESHLFGHVKGAVTGAIDNRDGIIALAHTGTLFIDEIGELSLPVQAKLLRVIQTREVLAVGGTKPKHTDVRLITATHRDLRAAVANGTFRDDLYYRIAVVTIHAPALRDRRQDIPLLIDYFVRKFAKISGKSIRGVDPSAVERLASLPWPGNIRQLENLVERAVVLAEGPVITVRDFFGADDAVSLVGIPMSSRATPAGLPLRECERAHILATVQMLAGNRTRAAKALGISVRCLQYKLKAYGIGAMHRARNRASLGYVS